jgi:hypothetical protein
MLSYTTLKDTKKNNSEPTRSKAHLLEVWKSVPQSSGQRRSQEYEAVVHEVYDAFLEICGSSSKTLWETTANERAELIRSRRLAFLQSKRADDLLTSEESPS